MPHLVLHMKTGSPMQRLETLHAHLQHFDHSPDFGDSEEVAVIRKLLLDRIREAESALCYSVWVQSHAEAKSAARFSDRLQSRAEAA